MTTGTLNVNNINASGNINITGDLTVSGNQTFENLNGVQTLDIASHNGTDEGIKLGGTLVTSTAAELNIMDGVTATAAEINYNDITALGTSANSKVVTQSANGLVDIASHNGSNEGLKLGGTLVTSTATELNIMDGVTATTTELNYNDITDLGTSEDSKVVTQSATGLVDIASHNGSNEGLKLGGTLVTSTATELNLLDGSEVGKTVNSVAAIYGNAGEIMAESFWIGTQKADSRFLMQDVETEQDNSTTDLDKHYHHFILCSNATDANPQHSTHYSNCTVTPNFAKSADTSDLSGDSSKWTIGSAVLARWSYQGS